MWTSIIIIMSCKVTFQAKFTKVSNYSIFGHRHICLCLLSYGDVPSYYTNYMKSIIWNFSTYLSILQLEHRQVCIAQTRLQAHKDDPWKDTTEDSLIGITLGSFWLRGSRANVVVETYMLKGKGCWICKHKYRLVSHIKWFFFFLKGKKQLIRELLQTLISLSLE